MGNATKNYSVRGLQWSLVPTGHPLVCLVGQKHGAHTDSRLDLLGTNSELTLAAVLPARQPVEVRTDQTQDGNKLLVHFTANNTEYI